MKNKIIPFSVTIIFGIIFFIFYKGLEDSKIYIPDVNIKKQIPVFNAKEFFLGKYVKSSNIFELDKIYLISFFIISILLAFLVLKNFNQNILINTILISSALYLFFITLRDFFVKKYKNISQNIAHFGFSLLILSILFNNLFASEIITNLKVGETFENSKTKIVFESVDQKKEKNYNAIIANFSISNQNGKEDRFSPELRIYNQPVIATSEADIKTTLMSDKFIVINLVQNQDFFNVRYQVKPFMLWIWLSVILISFGGIVSFLQKRS